MWERSKTAFDKFLVLRAIQKTDDQKSLEEKIDEKLNKLELVKSYCEKEIFSFELSYKKNPYEKLPADMS